MVLAEQADERAEERRYLGLDLPARCRLTLLPEISTKEVSTSSLLALAA